MECIDDGLKLFGPSVRHTVYWRLVVLHEIPRGGILDNPDAFVECLRVMFGAAARSVEIEILGRIKERFNLQYLESESLPEVIRLARKEIAQLIEIA